MYNNIFFLAVTAGLLVNTFQNCSAPKGAESSLPSTQSPSPGPSPSPDPNPQDRYKSGDIFNSTLIHGGQSLARRNKLEAYFNAPIPKALAINAQGDFYYVDGQTSQAEANRRAQQICQVRYDNRNCAVLAEGSIFKYNESELAQKYANSLPSGMRAFDPTQIPLVPDQVRTMAYFQRYFEHINGVNNQGGDTNAPGADLPRRSVALALTYWGGLYFNHYSPAGRDESLKRVVLQRCEGLHGSPCTLYSADQMAVFNVSNFNWNKLSQIDGYAGVPFCRDGVQNLFNQYPDTATNIFCHLGYAFGDQIGQAINYCNNSVIGGPDDAPCINANGAGAAAAVRTLRNLTPTPEGDGAPADPAN